MSHALPIPRRAALLAALARRADRTRRTRRCRFGALSWCRLHAHQQPGGQRREGLRPRGQRVPQRGRRVRHRGHGNRWRPRQPGCRRARRSPPVRGQSRQRLDLGPSRSRAAHFELVDTIGSGGDQPISLTVDDHLLYVLNAGGAGNITGFTFSRNDGLSPLSGSTRPLSGSGTGPGPGVVRSRGRAARRDREEHQPDRRLRGRRQRAGERTDARTPRPARRRSASPSTSAIT